MDEKRVERRTRVLKSGTISFEGGAISCIVRNISTTGALLEVESPLGIPYRFILLIPTDHFSRSCRRVWTAEHRVGIVFDQVGGGPALKAKGAVS